MERLKVENSHLVRDSYSKALLSTDKSGLDKYLREKKKKEVEQAKFAEIDSLKNEVNELKDMVKELLQRNSE